jgi:hypothetical protein
MVETAAFSNESHDALPDPAHCQTTVKQFQRELKNIARDICTRILKETKSRSHKQVMHYPKSIKDSNDRIDLSVALNQIYSVRARSPRKYIDASTLRDRMGSTRYFLPTLAKHFRSVAKDAEAIDNNLAAMECGLTLIEES